MDTSYIALIRDFGFPVVVCVWFMWRMERRLDRQAALLSNGVGVLKLIARSLDLSENERQLLEDSGK